MDRNQSSAPPLPGGRGRGRPNRGRAQGAGGNAASTAASWRSTAPGTTSKSEPAALPSAAGSLALPPLPSTVPASSTSSAEKAQAAPPRPRSRPPSVRRSSSRRTSVSDTAQSADIPPLPTANADNSQTTSSLPQNGSRPSRRAGRSRSGSKAGAHVPPPLSPSAHMPSVPAVASAPANVSGFSSRSSIDSLVQHIRAIAIDHSNKNGDWAQDDDDTLPDLDDWNVGGQRGVEVLSPVRETSPTELLVPPSVREVPVSAPPDVPVHAIPANPPPQAEQPHKKAKNSRGKGKRKGQTNGTGEAADGAASGAVPDNAPSTSTASPSVSARPNTTAREALSKRSLLPRQTSQTFAKRDPQAKGGRPTSAASRVSPVPGASTAASVPSTFVLEHKAEAAPVVQTSSTSVATLSLSVDPPSISASFTRHDVQARGDTTIQLHSQQEPGPHIKNIVTLDSPTSSRPRTPLTPNLRPSSRQLRGSTPTTPIRMRRDDLPTHARTHSHDPTRFGRCANRETFSPTHTPSSSRPRINLDALSKISRSLGNTTPPTLRSAAVTGQ